ncbi:DUF3426 domain-containing protein [Phenylobacterium sp.]|uniref:DUF3426 domain-containing protein n=1 Tax=Phenylobacterium sp. TaxID=1871053 RepID=UPI003D26632C
MILSCPECATSYFVDDLRIPRMGRMVKCTSCGHRWRAFQDRGAPEEEPPKDDLVIETPAPEPAETEIDFVPAPAKPAPKPEKKKQPLAVVIAAGVLVALALGGGAAVLLRQQVAGMIPGTAPLFSAIGLPVNTIGLVIEGVTSKPMLQAGRPVWSVTGAIRNVRDEPIASPPIRLSLLDAEDAELATLVADALNARVPPGAVRYFSITMPDPPAGAKKLQVRFELPAKGADAAHAGKAHAEPAAAPPAPEPAEAQPLPADSPDALHAPDQNEQH